MIIQSADGWLWTYPAVMALHFVLPRRAAQACSAALALAAAFWMHQVAGSASLRFAVTLGLVAVMTTVVRNALDRLEGKLASEATTDPLTGAFNRRHMTSCLEAAIERRHRTAEPASLLVFDVDRFKQINDARGHAAGDRVLNGLVTLVEERARRLDVLFRLGGDEFVLLLPGCGYAGAVAIAEHLRATVAGADLIEHATVTVSIGISELQAGQAAGDWLAEADAALYRAKQAGRNRTAGATLAMAARRRITESRTPPDGGDDRDDGEAAPGGARRGHERRHPDARR
jgi:diguanylate cyclase (GGDEF)-like protein